MIQKLIKKGIYLLTPILPQTLTHFEEELKNFDSIESISIYINSPGGSLNTTYKLIKLLKPFDGKITTIGLFHCMSAATDIFF